MTEKNVAEDTKTIIVPEVIPILPLYNVLLFPKMMLPLEVIGPRSIQLVDDAMIKDRIVGYYGQKRTGFL